MPSNCYCGGAPHLLWPIVLARYVRPVSFSFSIRDASLNEERTTLFLLPVVCIRDCTKNLLVRAIIDVSAGARGRKKFDAHTPPHDCACLTESVIAPQKIFHLNHCQNFVTGVKVDSSA